MWRFRVVAASAVAATGRWAPPAAARRGVVGGRGGRSRLRVAQVTLMREALDGRRERLSASWRRVRLAAFLELGDELEDTRPALSGVVEPDVELGDALQAQPVTELAPDEAHRFLERAKRLGALPGLSDDADPHLGMPKIGRGLDVGDGREPDPRVPDLFRQERPDLLPEEFVDAFSALRHPDVGPSMGRRQAT